jgi:NAD(P)-dependent dehydrogenase (short-subunit alcohol dehydrogenase family)
MPPPLSVIVIGASSGMGWELTRHLGIAARNSC